MDTYQQYPHSHTAQVYNHQPQYRPFPPTTHVKSGSVRAGPYGAQRWQYFKRPLRADNQQAELHSVDYRQQAPSPMQHVDSPSKEEQLYDARMESPEPPTKDVGTQSIYRESETQTDPYKPDVFVPDGEYPEVLALAELKCAPGFPIGVEQLKEIDRIRRRREVEANLPMGIDKKAFEKRVTMLKDLEMAEWKERESKIKAEQNRRLKKIEERLLERESKREAFNRRKINKLKEREQEKLNRDLGRISYNRQKILRKVQMKHENPENKLQRRDIIMEQTFYAPPLMREGRITHDQAIAYEIRPALLTDPKGVQDVDENQASRYYKLKNLPHHEDLYNLNNFISTHGKTGSRKSSARVKPLKKITNAQRKKAKIAADIEFAKKIQELSKQEKPEENTNLLDMYRATPRVHRPPTPILEFDDEEEDLENAVICIQKLMRGRQAQNDFSVGKDRALELIKELQEVEKVVRREHDLKNKNPNLVKQAKEKLEHQVLEEVVDNVQGEVVSKALDYLAKQIIRSREMDKIERIRATAELERRNREAKELARRQEEEELRFRQEEQFANIAATTDDTITTYLADVFDQTADRLAYNQALKEVYKLVKKEEGKYDKKRSKEFKKSQDGRTQETDEKEIRSLVQQFLIPQVKRSTLREKLERDQKKYIKAVHEKIQGDLVDQVVQQAS